MLGTLVLELGLVQRLNNFRNGQWDGEQSTKHALNEDVSAIFVFAVSKLFLVLFKRHRFTLTIFTLLCFQVSTSHHVDASVDQGSDQTEALSNNHSCYDVVENDEVAKDRDDLKGGVE